MRSEAGTKSSQNAYDKSEFLASTDERFRPVNMYNSPDGTLYVVDMYRGVIQEGVYIKPYLRKEIKDRGFRMYQIWLDEYLPEVEAANRRLLDFDYRGATESRRRRNWPRNVWDS